MAVNNTQIIVNNGNVQTVISTPSPTITIAAGSSGSSLAVPPLSLVGNYTGVTVNPPLFITLGTNLSFAGSVLNAANASLANGNATTFNVNKVDLGGTLVQNTTIDGHFNLTIGSATPVALFSVFGGLDLTTFSSLSLNLSAAQLRHFEPAGITGSLTLDSTSATLIGGLAGANPHTQIVLSGTAATFTDTRATPVGLQEAADYSASYTNLSYTNKGYVLGAKTYTGKQTFVQTTTTSPINLVGFASDPSVPLEGEISYNTTSHLLKFYNGTSWIAVNAAPPAWLLASGGTLTGVNTITSNAGNQLLFGGTWTATAAADSHIAFGGTLTAASGLGVTGYVFNPTLNAVGTSSVQVGLDVNPTFAGGTTPVNVIARFQSGGLEQARFLSTGQFLFNYTTLAGTEYIGIQNNQNALTTGIAVINTTSGTAGAARIILSTSATLASGLELRIINGAFSPSGINSPPGSTTTAVISATNASLNIGTTGSQLVSFWTGSGERARFLSTGEFLVGYTTAATGEVAGFRKDQNGGTVAVLINNTSGTSAYSQFIVSNSSTSAPGITLTALSAAWTTSGIFVQDTGVLNSNKAGGISIGTTNFAPIKLWISNAIASTISSSGNWLISPGNPGDLAKVYISQAALSSGWIPALRIDPGAHTSLTAATEFKDYNFNTRTATWLAGTTATQRFAHFQGQTVAGASASATFTDLYTVYIDPSIQGSQAIITNNWALGVGGNASIIGKVMLGPVGSTFLGAEQLSIRQDQNSDTFQTIQNFTTGTAASAAFFMVTGSGARRLSLYANSSGFLSSGIRIADSSSIYCNYGNLHIGTTLGTFSVALWTNTIQRQTIDGNGLFTFTQSAQAVSNTFITFTQAIHTGGTPTGLLYTQGAHTGLTLSVESLAVNLNTSATVQYATGAQTILRNILVQAPTIGFVGASTITDNATFTISGAPKAGTNTTQTNTHGLLIQAGAVTSAGSAFGLTVNAPTGGTLNYAAQTKGGSFLFAAGTTTYAPIIVPTGTNLTTSAAGALENDGTHLWFTFANSGARWQLDNQVGTFGWALAGNTLVADGIIGDVGTGGFKISLYTNNTARQAISSKGNFTFNQDAQSTSHTFISFTQGNHTGGTPLGINYNAGGAVTLAANTEPTDISILLGRTVQFATGAHGGVRAIYISNPIYSFVGASTMAIASLMTLAGAPIAGNNATITNVHGININSNSVITGTGIVTNSYALTASAQTGATNNYAAQFLGGNVGIGISAPVSALDVAGSFGTNTRTITASATLVATDHTVLCDSTSGVVAVTLPAASGAKGRMYVVKKIDASANNVTLATVDGGTKTITTRYAGFVVQSDGSLWYVIGAF